MDEVQRRKNRTKAGSGQVEHPSRILKRVFGFVKVRFPQLEEKSPSPVRRLCAGKPVHAPRKAGPDGGVVCLQSGESTLCG